jgi:hypothetical protein
MTLHYSNWNKFLVFLGSIILKTNSSILDSAKESDLQDLMTELTILKEVNKVPHPNVIRLIGGCSIGGTQIVLFLTQMSSIRQYFYIFPIN